MDMNNYFKLCSKQLLNLMAIYTNDSEFNKCVYNYNSLVTDTNEVDYSWMLIASSLLASENLWKNESLYKLINSRFISIFIESLYEEQAVMRGDENLVDNALLSKENLVANPFTYFFPDPFEELVEKNDNETEEDRKRYIEREIKYNKMKEKSMAKIEAKVKTSEYGANTSLFENAELDIKRLIIRIRHALAHSNFEIRENGIRLYHKDPKTKELDFNIFLRKDTVVCLIDELNELYESFGNDFLIKWYRKIRKLSKYADSLNREELLTYVSEFDDFDNQIWFSVIEEAEKRQDFYNWAVPDQLEEIIRILLSKIKPVCSYGLLINEHLYGNNQGEIDGEFYDKVGFYNYLNSPLFNLNIDSDSSIFESVFDEENFELLLFAYLNTVLLNSVNMNHQIVRNSSIDFSAMDFNQELLKVQEKVSVKEITDLQNQIINVNKKIKSLDEHIKKLEERLKMNSHINNEYYKVLLPEEIVHFTNTRGMLIYKLNQMLEQLQILESGERKINVSNYILNHLRNSLAHGYVKISDLDLNNICATEIKFTDYNPNNKKQETFAGKITLGNLLKILTSRDYVENILDNNCNEQNKR